VIGDSFSTCIGSGFLCPAQVVQCGAFTLEVGGSAEATCPPGGLSPYSTAGSIDTVALVLNRGSGWGGGRIRIFGAIPDGS
jgi:hypothetical protein